MTLDAVSIQPFVVETLKVFETLIGVRLGETGVETKDVPNGTFDVSVVVGLSGPWRGALVLSCPQEVACRIVSRMVRESLRAFDADVADGISELANIVAGNACRHLAGDGGSAISITIPAVVVGRHRIVWRSKDLPCLMMRFFDSELGPLCIEVNLSREGP